MPRGRWPGGDGPSGSPRGRAPVMPPCNTPRLHDHKVTQSVRKAGILGGGGGDKTGKAGTKSGGGAEAGHLHAPQGHGGGSAKAWAWRHLWACAPRRGPTVLPNLPWQGIPRTVAAAAWLSYRAVGAWKLPLLCERV